MHKGKECFLLKNHNIIVADPSQHVTIYLFIWCRRTGTDRTVLFLTTNYNLAYPSCRCNRINSFCKIKSSAVVAEKGFIACEQYHALSVLSWAWKCLVVRSYHGIYLNIISLNMLRCLQGFIRRLWRREAETNQYFYSPDLVSNCRVISAMWRGPLAGCHPTAPGTVEGLEPPLYPSAGRQLRIKMAEFTTSSKF